MSAATADGRATGKDSAGEASGVRSVQRAMDILSLLTEDRPVVTIRDITDGTGLAKTTVIRLVQTLEQTGLLWATSGGYLAGPALWRWAHLARSSWEMPPELTRAMRDLSARHRETVNLYGARDLTRICLAQHESPQPLRHVVRIGDELPLWGGASAKVLLRDADENRLKRIVRSSPDGNARLPRLKQEIAEASVQGFAISHGEREAGLSAVAVAIEGRAGAVVAALTLSGPTVRFGDEQVGAFAKDLMTVARQLSEKGFDHPLGA